MRTMAWIASWTVACAAASAGAAGTFVPAPLAPEHGVSVLNRSESERLVGRALLGLPAASAVLGEVHLYDRLPYVQARYVHVTSDASWKRLLYGTPGDAPRAYGAAGEFGEPRGMAFAPDGRLFVADRGRGRIAVLRLRWEGETPVLEASGGIDGLVQPMDVAVHDGGTPADPQDDRLVVAEAGAQRVALYDVGGAVPVRLSEFGVRGPGQGEFLYPRAVAVGRSASTNDGAVYVADSGNHRIVRLTLSGARLAWDRSAPLASEAWALDTDAQGNLYAALGRAGQVLKMTAGLEPLAGFTGGTSPLAAPRDVAVPFAWVHDHRRAGAAPAWKGQGSALVLEDWSASTGVRRLDLGVEIRDVAKNGAALEFVLTDGATLRAHVTSRTGAESDLDLGVRAAGRQQVALPVDAARVTLAASSSYDAARDASAEIDLAAVAPRRVVLHQNQPNPFNPTTTIVFDLPSAGRARLDVFDVRGQRVRTLADAVFAAGQHRVTWDGRDVRARRAGSGIYFYRLEHAGTTQVRKMVLAQ